MTAIPVQPLFAALKPVAIETVKVCGVVIVGAATTCVCMGMGAATWRAIQTAGFSEWREARRIAREERAAERKAAAAAAAKAAMEREEQAFQRALELEKAKRGYEPVPSEELAPTLA